MKKDTLRTLMWDILACVISFFLCCQLYQPLLQMKEGCDLGDLNKKAVWADWEIEAIKVRTSFDRLRTLQ